MKIKAGIWDTVRIDKDFPGLKKVCGYYVFDEDIESENEIQVELWAGLVVLGAIRTPSLYARSTIQADTIEAGNINVNGDLDAVEIKASGSVSVSGKLTARNGNVEADKEIRARGEIRAEKGSVISGRYVISEKGIVAGGEIKAGLGIKAQNYISAGTDIVAEQGVQCEGNIEAGENIKAGGSIVSGQEIKACKGDIISGRGITAGHRITAGNMISAQNQIFSGVSADGLWDGKISCRKLESGDVRYGKLFEKEDCVDLIMCAERDIEAENKRIFRAQKCIAIWKNPDKIVATAEFLSGKPELEKTGEKHRLIIPAGSRVRIKDVPREEAEKLVKNPSRGEKYTIIEKNVSDLMEEKKKLMEQLEQLNQMLEATQTC